MNREPSTVNPAETGLKSLNWNLNKHRAEIVGSIRRIRRRVLLLLGLELGLYLMCEKFWDYSLVIHSSYIHHGLSLLSSDSLPIPLLLPYSRSIPCLPPLCIPSHVLKQYPKYSVSHSIYRNQQPNKTPTTLKLPLEIARFSKPVIENFVYNH